MDYGLLFDFDGTLADTLLDIGAAVDYAVSVLYGPQYKAPEQHYRRTVGKGLRNELKYTLEYHNLEYTEETLTEGLPIVEEYYMRHPADYSRPYPGMEELLCDLSKAGVKIGVYSNKSDCLLKIICPLLFPDTDFKFIMGLCPDIPRKPDPAGVRMFMKQNGLTEKNTMYIGDSEVDAETAKNSGLDFTLCTWGFRPKELLLQCAPESVMCSDAAALRARLADVLKIRI